MKRTERPPRRSASGNDTLFIVFVLASLFFAFLPSSLYLNAGQGRHNFLLITIDTLRPDRLSCYGSTTIKTPNIDALAGKGVLFRRAFAHTPTTLPSHANILLGVTPLTHGVHDNSHFIVSEEFLNLAAHLKNHGYSTAAFVGAFPLDSRFGLTRGFDIYDDNYGSLSTQEFSYVERRAEVVVRQALQWLRGQKSPWFLWVHCFDPHQRYDPPEPFKTQYKERLYDGEIAYVDHALGELFAYLAENHLDEETLIIFTGDHGESLGQHGEATHGYFAYNATLWVPLIIASPGIKSGQASPNVCHIDIFPTACDILGIEKPSFLHGLSLLPALKGRDLPRRQIYFESLFPFESRGWAPLKGFIDGDEKYIDTPIPEFYNLDKDFDEAQNLAESINLEPCRKRLEGLIGKQTSTLRARSQAPVDRQTLERLESLGYISGSRPSAKKFFSREDDLKVLLPYQNKLMTAMSAYHQRQFEEGERLLREIIAERKDFDLAYSYLAALYKEQGKFREAVEVLREGFQNNPSSYKIVSTYGIYLAEADRHDEAIDILKKALTLIDYDPETWNYLGVAYWKKGAYDDALKAYERALVYDSNYPVVFNNLGSLYLSIFIKTTEQSAHQRATENFKKAIELDPDYASAYNGLGAALRMAGDLEGAIACWKKAAELKPDFGYPLYNLGLIYLAKGDKAQALIYFTRYKETSYLSLPPEEKKKLDDLIQKCRDEILIPNQADNRT